MTSPTTTRPGQSSRAANIALWVGQVLLAAMFGLSGLGKLAGDQRTVDMFADIGAGQWLRYLTGALEVAGAVGLLIPALCGLAALGLAAVMAGAVVTDAFIVDGQPVVPAVLLIALALIAWFRRDRTAALPHRLRGRR